MRIDAKMPGAVGAGHWFAQAWASALAEVAEALDLGGAPGPLEIRATDAEPAQWAEWTEPLWHVQVWSPGDSARLWIGCAGSVPRALWTHIGGGEPDGSAQALETFREMLNQSASSAALEAGSRLGSMLHAAAFEQDEPPKLGWAFELRFRAGDEDCAVAVAGNVAMASMLRESDAERIEPAGATPSAATPPPDPLDLIREVSLELAVSFGDTTMPLADVLALSHGAIIELNRAVSDPVEVLVNDSVIAHGEVVVVDGNYGVRITEIVSRRDRVRSML